MLACLRSALAVALVLAWADPASAQEVGRSLDSPSVGIPSGPEAGELPAGYGALPEPREDAPRARGGYLPTFAVLVPGLAAFLSSYVSGALTGALTLALGSTGAEWLLVPVVGPFAMAGEAERPDDVALFAVMGVVQLLGLGLTVTGLAINYRAGRGEPAPDERVEVRLAPALGPSVAGLSLTGSF